MGLNWLTPMKLPQMVSPRAPLTVFKPGCNATPAPKNPVMLRPSTVQFGVMMVRPLVPSADLGGGAVWDRGEHRDIDPRFVGALIVMLVDDPAWL